MARELPPDSWQTGTVVVTDFQTAGKGRQGRSWQAPRDSALLLSILLDLPDRAMPTDGLMVASLAVADAIKEVTGLEAALKWPNDVLLHGSKVCGILAEFEEQAGRRKLTLGMGLNVSYNPASAGVSGATSVSAEAGVEVSREALAIALFNGLDLWYCALTEDPDAVFAAWKGRLETVGHPVVVLEADRRWQGEAIGVHRNGGLQVRTADGQVRTVYAADVSVRRA